MNSRNSLKCKKSRGILVSFLIIVVFFATLELFLKYIGFSINQEQQILFTFHPFYNKINNLRYFTYDKDLLWKDDEVIKRVGRSKILHVLRIICLGDSTTMGYHLLSRGEDYPTKLEKKLNALFGFRKVEVINAGVGGYSSYQGLIFLKKYILKAGPDIVVLKFGINDSDTAFPLPDKQRKVDIQEERIDRLLNHFRTYQLFKFIKIYLWDRYYMKNQEKLPLRVNLKDFKENMMEMIRIARRNRINVVLVTSPFLQGDYFANEYNVVIREVAKESNVTLVDLADIFVHIPKYEQLFYDGCHLKSEGEDIVAENITRVLYNAIRNGKN